ncbi:alpha/beta-hydrolase [Lentinus tigrinus ALCF2SS1-7]|uniref:Alpha/beta-hydrolase n=1 Tax=Lentinus tigrinus ALCF2SS1-6 TaxID=1328759 RepID=A0A5C2RPB9_9APHY|nr:alpha/beta-hydrolase [Lentinus tigrinus ALCF2SS1-6]RPD73204.1 alpha/beta-hydrolase [Lentinus tigrinus ALCF2SS1-7]
MSHFDVDTFTVDLRLVGEPLVTCAKRYTRPSSGGVRAPRTQADSKDTYTIVLAHALGHHKETWEPVISHLFALERVSQYELQIAEVWAIDDPDHGESATLNKRVHPSFLRWGRVSCRTYGGAVLALTRSGLLRQPSTSKIVLIGHSAGATGVVLSTMYPTTPDDIKLSSLILVEPWMVHPDIATSQGVRAIFDRLSQSALRRREVWSSREEARAYLASRGAWKVWDARAVDLYIRYGLTEHAPAAAGEGKSVTLSFPKRDESAAYADLGEGQEALVHLRTLCGAIPVHVILGEQQPAPVKEVQVMTCDRTQGRAMASITVIPKTGHMAPQQSPELVGEAIWGILSERSGSHATGKFRGKL